MTNLVSNAVKYSNDGGVIQISLEDLEKFGIIHVEDNGLGIPEKDLPHIFERFYRTDASRARKTGGSGIGLTIANSLVKAHGGTITVQSREGEGSCFSVRLPKN